MDASRFDSLTRLFAGRVSRRAALASALGLLAAAGARHEAGAQVSQAQCGNQFCASNPGSCTPGCVCCVYTNAVTGQVTNSRCRPSGTCSPGTVACPPGQVLGPSGVCAAPTTTTTTTTTTTPAPDVCAGLPDGTVCGTNNVGFCDGGECFRAFPNCSIVGCLAPSIGSVAIPSVRFCLGSVTKGGPCASSADCGFGQYCAFHTSGDDNACYVGCKLV